MATKAVMDAIQQQLRDAALVRNKNSVRLHAGKFTWAELKRRGFNAPALFITCMGWKTAREQDAAWLAEYEHVIDASFAIGIVTSNMKDPEARNLEGRLLAEQITLQLIDQDWGLGNCLAATGTRAEALFVAAAEEENNSLWMVRWNQMIGLNSEDWQASIDAWQRYTAEHVDPNDDNHIMATDTVEIAQT